MIEGIPSKDNLMKSIDRTSRLCWNYPISSSRIEEWINQFDGSSLGDAEEEQVLALLLLNNFVFYSQKEVRFLCKEIFDEFIHYFADMENIKGSITDFKKDIINNTIFVPIGNPSESSANLLYYFRQENSIPKNRFTYLGDLLEDNAANLIENRSVTQKVLNNYENIVFIDDVTLSGSQITRFVSSQKAKIKALSEKKIFFLPLIATDIAIKKINEIKDLKIIILPGIELSQRDTCFSEVSYIFQNNSIAKEKCEIMLKYYNDKFQFEEKFLGFNNGNLALGFFYNIPNNSLPIYWIENDSYKGMFPRNDKLYTKEYVGVINDGTRKYF